jgi:hypothetical protein
MFCLRTIGLLDTTGSDITRYSAWSLTYIPRALFLTKFVYLVIDLSNWAILRGILESNRRRTFDLVWLLSPITLLGVYLMGQTDIMATFWVVCALALAKRSPEDTQPQVWATLAVVWLIWLMPFLALAIAQPPGAFWLYGFICFHYLLYTISGWDPGYGFMLPLGNLFVDTIVAGAPRLRDVLFAGNELVLRRISVIFFSLFVVALWGIFVLVQPLRWMPVERRSRSQSAGSYTGKHLRR